MPEYLEKTRTYLTEQLIPFWASRIRDSEDGGFHTNYDRDGNRTAVREKTLLCQARSLFTIAHAQRLGFDWPDGKHVLADGIRCLERRFRNPDGPGYFWIVGDDGAVKDDRNVMYGLSFLVYAFSEVALLIGDKTAGRRAEELFDQVCARAADLHHGGVFEHFDRDFRPESVRPDGCLHKSLDVHMHLMEAFTALAEWTRSPRHLQALEEISELIFHRMVDPETGTGIAMFRPDWTPVSNVQLGTLWGSDRFDAEGKPPEITSYGHNIELAWLYLHSLRVRGVPPENGLDRVRPIFEHTARHGVDLQYGGLFVEGYRAGPVTEDNKEFWQQAEALVGFLDAYDFTGDVIYADAFRAVHDFVFRHVINRDAGEWFPLLARDGTVLWDYMGHNWKTCYHTVRSMCETVKRLERLEQQGRSL